MTAHEPVAVWIGRTPPSGEPEAELMLVVVDDEGVTLSLDDGETLDLDTEQATKLAVAMLSPLAHRREAA